MRVIFLLSLFLFLTAPLFLDAATFKVANYNVQNLFDLKKDGTEYPGYIPDTGCGWNEKTFRRKITHLAQVLQDLNADIIALEEVESENALLALRRRLAADGAAYPYSAITASKQTSVRCALLSRFPIAETREIIVPDSTARNILEVIVRVEGVPFTIFVNHWKSKSGPESRRLVYARALKQRIDRLPDDTDFILIGDFNEDYNEFQTFAKDVRLNDTGGVTGINQILKSVRGGHMVDELFLLRQPSNEYLYNLWLEVPQSRRWSYNFFGKKNSLDNILVSRGLYDSKGISYVDHSFHRFDPDYLFRDGAVFRWQRTRGGRGKHLGKGYSDHLPIYACFSTSPFSVGNSSRPSRGLGQPTSGNGAISNLYFLPTGELSVALKNCAVLWKRGTSCVIKQKGDRAIYIYRSGRALKRGRLYDLTVKSLNDYAGLREVTSVDAIHETGRVQDLSEYLLKFPLKSSSISLSLMQNEVIDRITGVYKRGYFYYDKGRSKVRLFFKDPSFRPKNGATVTIRGARIGFYHHPEIIIEDPEQIE